MTFFPSVFLKKEPPRKYFWSIYSTIFPSEFDKLYNEKMDRIRKKIRKPTDMQVTDEQKRILNARKDESIRMLLELKRSGTEKNITYLRKTSNPQEGSNNVEVSRQNTVTSQSRQSLGQSRQNFGAV